MPTTSAERQAKRDEILAQHMARAKDEASRVGRSITCARYGNHKPCRGAAVCLCECHDPEERP